MSSDIAIKVEGLGKCYHIYDRPRDRLMQMLFGRKKQYYREFWALDKVAFEVRKGETLAIIGKNGSGKSTLLQMICSTLNPTNGSIKVNGRVAALLELGAGFNPEFTGRENVYMAASLYGLKKEAIDQRFSSIAAFADIGDHIEQPVKTYSSGMYVRLAFAVIAHVDADILVIDEALAVGDAIFTQKCMRFIRSFQQKGTLLFVSHDTAAVQSLCEKALWLANGQVKGFGSSKEVSEAYLKYSLQEVYGDEINLSSVEKKSNDLDKEDNKVVAEQYVNGTEVIDYDAKIKFVNNLSDANGWKSGSAEIIDVRVSNLSKADEEVFEGGELVRLNIRARAYKSLERPIIGFSVKDRLGQDLFGENTLPFTTSNPKSVKPGEEFEGDFCFRLPMLPNGQYVLLASVADGDLQEHVQHHWLHDAAIISVSSSKVRWGLVGIKYESVKLSLL
ncbi:ABC transporter ATP-binding protein [Zobellella maritima]|uniref:ABC transporter ATP-binding protein n=1 Tax=Zobellella maritima TaxID=2059725 RepID=UPI000E3057EC|nr:ABC transporter ATP-binding protein [Zobellella maritima]